MTFTLIIDDEAHCRERLSGLLNNVPDIKVIGECGSVDEGIEQIKKLKPELVFLDVEMPVKNGFDLVDELNTTNFEIVFTTAHQQYALKAIKSSALDFLLKPVLEEELETTLIRFQHRKKTEQRQLQMELLLENLQNDKLPKRIAVPTSSGLEFVKTDKIVRLESESNYVKFFFSDGTKLLVAKTLKEMEEILAADNFYRIHSSHLVNLNYIKRFQKQDGGLLVMDNGATIPVSRQRKEDFIRVMKKH